MAGNTRRTRRTDNVLLEPDTDDDTTDDNSLDTAYLLMRTCEAFPRSASFPSNPYLICSARWDTHMRPHARSVGPVKFASTPRAEQSLVNSTAG
jgi:hypothetical protein